MYGEKPHRWYHTLGAALFGAGLAVSFIACLFLVFYLLGQLMRNC